jgi:hypothetical protein
MPKYTIDTGKKQYTLESETPLSDGDISSAVESAQKQQTDEGFLGSFLPHNAAAVGDQGGLGILQGFTEAPGAVGDLTGWALNKLGKNTGLWGERDLTQIPLGSSNIHDALGPKGFGWLPDIEALSGPSELVNAAGRGIGSVAALGGAGTGLAGFLGGAGSGAGSYAAGKMFPGSEIAPIVGGLLGGFAGGYAGMKTPTPEAGLSDEALKGLVSAGKGRVSTASTPAGEVIDPATYTPASAAAKATAEDSQGALNQLQLINAVRKTPQKADQLLTPIADATRPSWGDRAKYMVGAADPETAYNTAVYDAANNAKDFAPGLGMSKSAAMQTGWQLAKSIGLAKAGHFGHAVHAISGIMKLLGGQDLGASTGNALDTLETIVRTGKPIPTKGTVVSAGARGLLSTVGKGANAIAERYGVDPGPGEARFSGLPLFGIKPSALARQEAENQGGIAAWHGSPYDHNGFDERFLGQGQGKASYGDGVYNAEAKPVGEGYARMGQERLTLRSPTGEIVTPPSSSELSGILSEWHDAVVSTGQSQKAALRDITENLDENIRDSKDPTSTAYYKEQRKVLQWIASNKLSYDPPPPGTLYRTQLQVHPDSLINFDKPLSAQSGAVKEGLFKAMDKLPGKNGKGLMGAIEGAPNQYTGEDAYWIAHNTLESTGQNARKGLLSEGLQGNKYFDGFSRVGGGDTHNYVVYDPQKVKILEKFKVPLYSIAGGGFMVKAADMPDQFKKETVQ